MNPYACKNCRNALWVEKDLWVCVAKNNERINPNDDGKECPLFLGVFY